MASVKALLPNYHELTSKWLHMPIELQHREFASKLLLACVAAERGYSVILGEQSKFHRTQSKFPVGVVLEKSCGSSEMKLQIFNAYKKAGHILTVIDEESPSIYSRKDYWFRVRLSPVNYKECSQYYVWGEEQAEIIKSYLPENSGKLITTGSHRVDVWKKPLCQIHQGTADIYKKKYGPYILMPSNIAGPINARGPAHSLKHAREFKIVKNEEEEAEFNARQLHKKKVFDEYVKVFPKIMKAFPAHTLIIRPHPADDHSFWERAITGFPRAKVIFEGEVTPWLLGADAIFQDGCTTALEANMMGLQPLTYMPVVDKRFNDVFLSKCGPIAHEHTQLIKNISDVINGITLDYAHAGKMERYVSSGLGKLACDRIVDAIDDLSLSPQTNRYTIKQYAHIFRERMRPQGLRTVPMAARKRARMTSAKSKWPGLHLSELENRLQIYRDTLGRFKNVQVADYERRLFLVYQS